MNPIQTLHRLMAGPDHSWHPFVMQHAVLADIYALAHGIRPAFEKTSLPVCVATAEKELIAAALLAALDTGTVLVMPPSLSAAALSDVRNILPFDVAVTDDSAILPEGVIRLATDPYPGLPASFSLRADTDAPWVYFFTGGSTGKPALWSKTPVNLFAEAIHQARRFGICREDRILATIPPYHIYGFLFSVLIPLVSGAAVIRDTPSFPEEIRRTLVRQSATVLVSVPMHYRVVAGVSIPNASLRMAFSSAGRLEAGDADGFFSQTGCRITEIYGSTETGGIAHRRWGDKKTDWTAFEEVEWKIIQDRLCVRSPYLSPELPRDPEGFYKTDDRVFHVDDGCFRLLGRADGVVKIGGKRVDAEDIREKIKSFSDVSDALVIAVPAARGRENILIALVQGNGGPEEWKQRLAALVEPHAVPRRILKVDRIPVSAAGKIDRIAIERLIQQRPPK